MNYLFSVSGIVSTSDIDECKDFNKLVFWRNVLKSDIVRKVDYLNYYETTEDYSYHSSKTKMLHEELNTAKSLYEYLNKVIGQKPLTISYMNNRCLPFKAYTPNLSISRIKGNWTLPNGLCIGTLLYFVQPVDIYTPVSFTALGGFLVLKTISDLEKIIKLSYDEVFSLVDESELSMSMDEFKKLHPKVLL